MPAAQRATLLLILAIFSAHAATAAQQQWPVVHLRTRRIQPREELLRPEGRRLLQAAVSQQQQHHHHTASDQWGSLKQSHQFLLTHQPGLQHEEQQQLVQHVEAAGCHVAHYLPDHTLLLVGPAEAAERVQQHPHVLWLGLHDDQDKLAPDWQPILQQLREQQQLEAPGQQQQQQQAAAANGSQPALIAELRAALPVATQWDAASGQLLVGATVEFPGLVQPNGREAAAEGAAGASSAQQQQQQRSRRITLQRQQQDSGAAADADWAPLLLQQFGARMRRASADSALVLSPAQHLPAVLEWLAQRPAAHWVAPAPKLRLSNKRASSIAQAARAPSELADNLDPGFHPMWAAGITGQNQTIGCGDSGIDRFHCFFVDPNVEWNSYVKIQDGVRTFDSTAHRKIRYYRAFGDTEDSNGHGSHVVGTLVGLPYGSTVQTDTTGYIGMAPDAKVAFIDLADSSSDTIFTPSDLVDGYFSYTSAVGAMVHSDSWGATSIYYDFLAAQVDMFAWSNPEFLPVFAAGNDGDKATGGGSSGEVTVTSPANAKNCLSVGATQTSGEGMETTAVKYAVWDATATQGEYSNTFRVMQAGFGGSVASLTGSYPLVVASPLDGCTPLQNDAGAVKGTVVLMQRGTCYFSEKALHAQDMGAAGVLIFDNMLGAYFTFAADVAVAGTIKVPVMSLTRRLGQGLNDAASTGKALTLTFAASTVPINSFENLASYSSQGPTPDNRVKPDIVAPGTVTSAKVGYGSNGDCALQRMSGTSMATPVVAGSATLLRQYFMDGFYPSGGKKSEDGFTPTGALLKATMLGGAASITGYEADTGLPVDPPPSFRQGFGRVWLGNSVFLSNTPGSPQLQVVDAITIKQDQAHEYCVKGNGGPLSITLVWTDYPASPSASKSLVNDLDLTVRAAGFNGIPLLGNGGSVSDPSMPDRENNVEQVALNSLPAGPVSISVRGHSIFGTAGPPQYALVVNGDFSGTLSKPGEGGDQCTITVATITSGPEAITSANTIVFQFGTQTGSTGGVTFECKLGDSNGNITAAGQQDWKACTSPASYGNLADGSYQFAVRASGEDIASTQNFVKDTTPPVVAFTLASPAASTTDATSTFQFSGSDATGVNFTCTLSASGTMALQPPVLSGSTKMGMQPVTLGQSYNCSSPQLFHWHLPGSWQLQVVGTDVAGNRAAPQTHAWAVAFAPNTWYTRLLSGPFGLQPKGNLTFTFATLNAAGEQPPAASHECWLEAASVLSTAAYTACTSPMTLPSTVEDGQYRFHARLAGVVPAAGTEALSTFSVDSVAPVTSITEKPAAIHRYNSTVVRFNSSEEASSFYCSLSRSDPGAAAAVVPALGKFRPCVSPEGLTNLTDGKYIFAVYAIDSVGNTGVPATTAFQIDDTPPTFTTLDFPAATSQPSITVTFVAEDAGSGIRNVTCRFRELAMVSGAPDGKVSPEWALCTSPQKYTGLEEGRYGLTLRAADNAGLVSQTDEAEVYVDFTAPRVSSQGFPPIGAPVPSRVTFRLSELSTAPANSYSNITTYQTLVQTVPDAAAFTALQNAARSSGTATAGSATRLGTVDGGERRRLLQDSGSSGGGGGVETVLPASSVGTWTNCSSECTYEGLSSGLYSIQVRGVDAAGNAGNASDPYPFEVDSSIGKKKFPLWAIVACAAGGALVLLLLGYFMWRCCCRRTRAPHHGGAAVAPVGAMAASHQNGGYPHPASSGYPAPYTNGYAGGYPANSAAANGAWGYGAQQQQSRRAPGYANGYANGYATAPAAAAAAAAVDPMEEQQVALALAASLREQQRQQQLASAPAQPLSAAPKSAAEAISEEQLLRLALDASLQEQRRQQKQQRDDDPQLRAAIEASLREQHQPQSWGRQPSGAGASAGGSNSWADFSGR